MLKKFFITIAIFVLAISANAQNKEAKESEEPKHILAVGIGYTYIPKGAAEDALEAEGVFVPSIGLDYFYRIAPRWEIGLMTDLELGEYLVFEKDLNREYALVVAAVANFSLTENLKLFAGGGIELEKNKNLRVFRLGIDYGFKLKKNWILAPGFFFDIKEGYDTFLISIAIGKEF